MIRIVIVIAIIFISKLLFSQDYRPVSSHSLTLFKTEFNYDFATASTEYYASASGYYDISGVRIDSNYYSGQDSIFIFNTDLRKSSSNDNYYPYEVCYKKAGSVFGKNVIFDSTYNCTFKNMYNENIFFKMNPEWLFFSNDSLYFIANIIGYVYSDVLNIYDSVKVIQIQAFNYNDEPVNNECNTQILISKHFGLIDFPSLEYFPKKYIRYKIAGIPDLSIGKKILTNRDVFNFYVGDEIHYTATSWNFLGNYGPTIYSYIKKIISKNISVNQDTIFYEIEFIKTTDYNFISGEHYFEIDSGNYSLNITNLDNFIAGTYWNPNILPYEHIDNYPDNINNRFYQMIEDSNMYLKTSMVLASELVLLNTEDSCEIADHSASLSHLTAIDGLGTFRAEYQIINGEPDPTWPPLYYYLCRPCENLVYYKKGNEIWGNPIVITNKSLLNKSQTEISIIGRTISFNYFSDQTKYIIYDIFGRILKNGIIPVNTYSLTLSDLSSGIYFLSVFSDNKILTKKIIF